MERALDLTDGATPARKIIQTLADSFRLVCSGTSMVLCFKLNSQTEEETVASLGSTCAR